MVNKDNISPPISKNFQINRRLNSQHRLYNGLSQRPLTNLRNTTNELLLPNTDSGTTKVSEQQNMTEAEPNYLNSTSNNQSLAAILKNQLHEVEESRMHQLSK